MNFSIVYILIYEGKNEVVLKTFTVSTNSKLSGHDFCPYFTNFLQVALSLLVLDPMKWLSKGAC